MVCAAASRAFFNKCAEPDDPVLQCPGAAHKQSQINKLKICVLKYEKNQDIYR
jgi:hypothetical protein